MERNRSDIQDLCASILAAEELPSIANDRAEIAADRVPSERVPQFTGVGDQLRGIAFTTRRDDVGHFLSSDVFHGAEYFEHGMSDTSSDIESVGSAAGQ